MKRKLFILVFAAALSCTCAFAQRQTPGRFSVEAYGSVGKGFNPLSLEYQEIFAFNGGGLNLSYYDYSGRMVYGVDAFMQPHCLVEEAIEDNSGNLIAPEETHYMQAVNYSASAGYLYRLWGLRSRALTLSAGASLLVGASVCEDLSLYHKSARVSEMNAPVGFYLAAVPEVQLECFPFRNLSVYASFRPRMRFVDTLAGKSDWLLLSGSFGLKVYL